MGILSKLIFGDLLGGLVADATAAVEAEGRQLRRGVMQLLLGVYLLVASLVVLLAALGFILWGFCTLLTPAVGQVGSAFIVGGVALLVSVVLAVYARNMAK